MRWFVAIALLACGCEVVSGATEFEVSPLVGDWESEATVLGKKVEAHFFGDRTGDVIFPAIINLQPVVLHADATWKATHADEFHIELVCDDATVCLETTPKEDRTFVVNCEAKDDDERLKCQGTRADDEPFELVRSK